MKWLVCPRSQNISQILHFSGRFTGRLGSLSRQGKFRTLVVFWFEISLVGIHISKYHLHIVERLLLTKLIFKVFLQCLSKKVGAVSKPLLKDCSSILLAISSDGVLPFQNQQVQRVRMQSNEKRCILGLTLYTIESIQDLRMKSIRIFQQMIQQYYYFIDNSKVMQHVVLSTRLNYRKNQGTYFMGTG